MNRKTTNLIILLLLIQVNFSTLYSCFQQSFERDCKQQLYSCTNDPECSYQLHQNTHHIFITKNTQKFPSLYFSNPLARNLYKCLMAKCNLPEIDETYPKTLPFDSCLIQLYDICRGNIQQVYQNPQSQTQQNICYRKYCNFPQLSNQ